MTRMLLRALLAGMALAVLLAGCGQTSAGQNFTRAIEDWQAPSNSREASEIVAYTDGDFSPTLGFNLTAYPQSDALGPERFFAIAGWFGQVEYKTGDGRVLVLRAAPADARLLSSAYAERHSQQETRMVDGVEVQVRTAKEGCTAVTWERDGFQYLLHSNASQPAPLEEEIEAFVAGTAAAAVPTESGSIAG